MSETVQSPPEKIRLPTESERVVGEDDVAVFTFKAHLFVTICHWGMVILLTLNLLSGMRIGWGYVESPLGGATGTWGALIAAIAPKGTMFGINLLTLHVMLAFFMLLVAGVYVGYLVRSRTTRRLR